MRIYGRLIWWFWGKDGLARNITEGYSIYILGYVAKIILNVPDKFDVK